MMTSSLDYLNEPKPADNNLIAEIAAAQVKSVYSWSKLRETLISRLENVPSEMDGKGMLRACISQLNYLIEAPFTIQRVCELILMLEHFQSEEEGQSPSNPQQQQYTNFEKYMNALYKCLNVTSRCDDLNLLSSDCDNTMDTS